MTHIDILIYMSIYMYVCIYNLQDVFSFYDRLSNKNSKFRL